MADDDFLLDTLERVKEDVDTATVPGTVLDTSAIIRKAGAASPIGITFSVP